MAGQNYRIPTSQLSNVYNVKLLGAAGNGVTDDTAVIQAAATAAGAAGGGTVFFPVGTYLITSAIVMPPGVRLQGVGPISIGAGIPSTWGQIATGTILTSNGADNSIVSFSSTMDAGGLQDLQIIGGGPQSLSSAVNITGGAADILIRYCNITGGNYGINASTGSFRLENSFVGQTFGKAAIYFTSGGALIIYSWINQPWNNIGSPPVNATSVGTRARNQMVTAGQLYQYTDSFSKVWLLHVLTTGTTSVFSDPLITGYTSIIQDGSAQFYLRAPMTYYGLQIDTNSSVVTAYGTDFSGAHTAGVTMTNSLAGTVPQGVLLSNCTSSNSMNNAVLLNAGNEVIIQSCRFNQVTVPNNAVVQAGLSFGGDLTISDSTFKAANQGVSILGGVHTRIQDCRFGNLSTGINIGANVTDFALLANDVGGSNAGTVTNGITVNTGTSNFYTIIDNDTHGCTVGITDNGSGTNKRVQGVSQATPIRQTSTVFNPTGNSTTTRQMQGCAYTFTPAATGNVLVLVQCGVTNAVDQIQASVRLCSGTGVAPVNGASETGQVGNPYNSNVSGAAGQNSTTMASIITGLTVGTTYWLDVSLKSSAGGDLANCINIQFTVIEI